MIPRIADDPDVLELIYRHFDYLRGYPLRLQGSFSDEAVNLAVLAADDFLGFLMTYDLEEEHPKRDRFAFLTPEENLAITHYRHLRPVEPWPQPTVGIAWNTAAGEGRVLGTSHVDVVLKNVGNAQLWWGGKTGVIWEAFFEERVREGSNHELLMHQLWDALERYLAGQGIERIFTYQHDPALDDAWYQAFLSNRDYRRDPEREALQGGRVAVVKGLI